MLGLRAASAPVMAQLRVPTYNATGPLLVARSGGPRQQKMLRVTAVIAKYQAKKKNTKINRIPIQLLLIQVFFFRSVLSDDNFRHFTTSDDSFR